MRVRSAGLVTDQALDLVTRRLTKLYSVEATHDVFGKADRHSTIPFLRLIRTIEFLNMVRYEILSV